TVSAVPVDCTDDSVFAVPSRVVFPTAEHLPLPSSSPTITTSAANLPFNEIPAATVVTTGISPNENGSDCLLQTPVAAFEIDAKGYSSWSPSTYATDSSIVETVASLSKLAQETLNKLHASQTASIFQTTGRLPRREMFKLQGASLNKGKNTIVFNMASTIYQ
ncbi:hypothetical protein HDU99_002692, partial [Rhizoclosmatium hyalinum]